MAHGRRARVTLHIGTSRRHRTGGLADDLDAIARRTAQAVEAGSLLERLDGYLREKMATVAPNLAALIGAGESGGATAAAAAPPVAGTAPPLADGEPEELEAPPPPPAPQQE